MYKYLKVKIMKTRKLLIAITFATGLFFASCEKDATVLKPVVTITELGYENSKIGYAGSDLHIEAEIVAEGRIDKVTIEIHREGDHNKSLTIALYDNEWEVDTTYTKFSGLKNATFHEHIEIPVYAEPGDYHFHFIVTDMEGNQTSVEEEIEIQ